MVAVLARRFGDLDVAEDATAEACATAVTRWPVDGVSALMALWCFADATAREAIRAAVDDGDRRVAAVVRRLLTT